MDWDLYNELIELRDSGRIDEAIVGLTKLADIETEPSEKATAMIAIANGFTLQNRLSDARRKLHEATGVVGSDHAFYPRLLLAIAVVDMNQENWKDALKKLNTIIEKYKTPLELEDNKDVFEEVQRNRGIALFELNRIREALPLLQSVRSTQYQKERTLYSIAMTNFELKDHDAAILDFQELLSLHPESVYLAHAHYHLGRIYYAREQLARAKTEFEKCLTCPDRGNISDEHLLQALVFSSKGLNLQQDAARYTEMLENLRGRINGQVGH